jgi:hypothetical protein
MSKRVGPHAGGQHAKAMVRARTLKRARAATARAMKKARTAQLLGGGAAPGGQLSRATKVPIASIGKRR